MLLTRFKVSQVRPPRLTLALAKILYYFFLYSSTTLGLYFICFYTYTDLSQIRRLVYLQLLFQSCFCTQGSSFQGVKSTSDTPKLTARYLKFKLKTNVNLWTLPISHLCNQILPNTMKNALVDQFLLLSNPSLSSIFMNPVQKWTTLQKDDLRVSTVCLTTMQVFQM